MRAVHVLASTTSTWGGPPRVVRDLASGLSRLGVENVIVTLDRTPEYPLEYPGHIRLERVGRGLVKRLAIPSGSRFALTIWKQVRSADVVHIHELWHFLHIYAAVVALLQGKPYVVSCHGELKPWAMQQRRLLKKIAWHGYERYLLRHSAGIQALTPGEEKDIRAFVERTPICVIPNGIDVTYIQDFLEAQAKRVSQKETASKRYILYMSRIAEGKGLDVLIDSFCLIGGIHPDVSLVVAGPDDERLFEKVVARVADPEIEKRIAYLGVVTEPQKFMLLSEATVFALPSISEGQSIATLEALACGTPVVLSPGCNMPEVESSGAGRIVPRSASDFAKAIHEILVDSEAETRMRTHARRLAFEQFSIDSVAKRMLEFYQKVCRS